MDNKPKISAEGTYVLDEDELDQLDELSITSVMDEATASFAQPHQEFGEDSPEEYEDPNSATAMLPVPHSKPGQKE